MNQAPVPIIPMLAAILACTSVPAWSAEEPAAISLETVKPNIIVIMTDDMGYSDLGCYGSEIATPNIDALAEKGIRFSDFYNTSRCCPTRASLMTGLYSHQAGMGLMTRDEGPDKPGYRGRLMERCVTMAEVLGPRGYRCIITGKWHMGSENKEWWPLGRGFDSFYGCPQGGGFYFRPSSWSDERFVVRDNEILERLGKHADTFPPRQRRPARIRRQADGLQYGERSARNG